MKREDLEIARVAFDHGALHAPDFDDHYFSTAGGLAETEHVFIAGNGLDARWAERDRFRIGETGFGSGLNFLSTWRRWQQDSHGPKALEYFAVERYPLSPDDIARCSQYAAELAEHYRELADAYPLLCPGFHRLSFDAGRIRLTLAFGDASEMLAQLQLDGTIDAWFLDGFAPSRNSDMWRASLFENIARLTAPSGTIATFTVAGVVRRGLEMVGFELERRAGFGRKREMLTGALRKSPSRSAWSSVNPCYVAPQPLSTDSAIIIGGGLAGTGVAASLLERGIEIDLIERRERLAAEASGNAIATYRPSLHVECDGRERFTTHGSDLIVRRLRQFDRDGIPVRWWPTGTAVLDVDSASRMGERKRRRSVELRWAKWLSADAISDVAGMPLSCDALYYPSAGCVDPRELCRANLSRGVVRIHFERGAVGIERLAGGWRVLDAAAREIACSRVVIIANSFDSRAFDVTRWLPLGALRGQVTRVPVSDATRSLATTLHFGGYLTPAMGDGTHTIGATFTHDDVDTRMRPEDDDANLRNLREHLPQIHDALAPVRGKWSGRASIRSTTPDMFPIIGPVPDYERYSSDFGDLEYGRPLAHDLAPTYLDGLYLACGYGSRGVATSALAGEIIASQLFGEIPPVEQCLLERGHPARFIVRALKRRRPLV